MQQTDDDLSVAVGELPNFRPRAEQFEDVGGEYPDESLTYAMPETVKKFIQFFYERVRSGSIYEIQDAYETTWHKLTERCAATVMLPLEYSPTTASSRPIRGHRQKRSSHCVTEMRRSSSFTRSCTTGTYMPN
jgi:hypothetical protein